MPKMPTKDEVTFRWLIDHIPISWWAAFFAALAAVFSAGIGAGRLSFEKLDGEISSKLAMRDQLQAEVQNLTNQKATLQSEVDRLKIDKETQQMSPDQVKEALKKWTRD
jgi:FtsZ-binding cell division protein ZapB